MTIAYAGPSTSSAFAAGVINDAWARVTTLEAEATDATTKSDTLRRPVVQAPLADNLDGKYSDIDAASDANSFQSDFDWGSRGVRLTAARAAIVNDIATDAKFFFKTYFSDNLDGTSVYDDAAAWINNLLLVGGTGVALEQVLRTRDIARITSDGLRALQDINAAWAVRGITLPARVAAYQTRQVGYVLGDSLGEAERNARIHSWDAEVANTTWAIERSLSLRSDAIDRCKTYVADWLAKRYDQINERENEQIDKLAEVQESYYKFMANQLGLRDVAIDRYLTSFSGDQMPKWKNKEDLKLTIYQQRIKSLEHRLQSLATRASASINSIHVQAEAGAQETV